MIDCRIPAAPGPLVASPTCSQRGVTPSVAIPDRATLTRPRRERGRSCANPRGDPRPACFSKPFQHLPGPGRAATGLWAAGRPYEVPCNTLLLVVLSSRAGGGVLYIDWRSTRFGVSGHQPYSSILQPEVAGSALVIPFLVAMASPSFSHGLRTHTPVQYLAAAARRKSRVRHVRTPRALLLLEPSCPTPGRLHRRAAGRLLAARVALVTIRLSSERDQQACLAGRSAP